jgi:hypothetical protein
LKKGARYLRQDSLQVIRIFIDKYFVNDNINDGNYESKIIFI